MRSALPFLALAFCAAPALAQGAGERFTIVETGQRFARLDDAVQSVRLGTATIVIAPGVYHECTVQAGGRITFKAATPGSVTFEGTTCEGKAAFVLRGSESVVDGIVFRGMHVADGNGAGIRIETGDLRVVNATFLDSQEGILGGAPTGQRISIDHSTFSGLGQCDQSPDCAHSIYLATRGVVRVTHCRFERGTGGHYVKLRAPQVDIRANSFDDSHGHKTNYMIDLSEGGTGTITDNIFVQGRDKENWTAFITVAAEARTYSAAGLRIEGNSASLAPGETRSPAFVADLSHQRLAIGANRLGPGVRAFELR